MIPHPDRTPAAWRVLHYLRWHTAPRCKWQISTGAPIDRRHLDAALARLLGAGCIAAAAGPLAAYRITGQGRALLANPDLAAAAEGQAA